MEQRLQWAYSDNSQNQMTSTERDMILSPTGIEFCRAYLVYRARDHAQMGTNGVDAFSRRSVAQLLQSESDELVQALTAIFEERNPDEIVTTAQLQDELGKFDLENTAPRVLKRTVN